MLKNLTGVKEISFPLPFCWLNYIGFYILNLKHGVY